MRSLWKARSLALVFVMLLEPAAALEFTLRAHSTESLSRPHDIVLSPAGDRLYVADNNNDRIVILDPLSLELRGVLGHNEVAEPHDVAFDHRGRLLVADTGNSRIAIYEVDGAGGRLVQSVRGRIHRPEGVAGHPDGRIIATGAGSGNLVIFRDGQVVAEADGLASPHDVVLGPKGSIWVADAANDRIVAFNPALEITLTLDRSRFGFRGPRYLDFDPAGRLYVADKYTHRILVIDVDARPPALIATLGTGKAGEGPGEFDRPEGVAIRGNSVWFADTYNNRIVRYAVQ